MVQFVLVSFAAFTVFMVLKLLLPFGIPGRSVPFVVGGIAYGILQLPPGFHQAVFAAACAGGVAVVYRFAVVDGPEPWSIWDALAWLEDRKPTFRRTPARPLRAGVGNRITPL